jgi:hypothetical protein
MEIMSYSRQYYYNQLKKKQYEEYLKRQNEYYLNKKKYDKEHNKRNNDFCAKKRRKEELSKDIRYASLKKRYEDYNNSHTSDITVGRITVRIPVVLAECNISLNIHSSCKLEDTVLEIKRIKKNAYLNQCKLIPNSENDKPNTGILFLSGFIRSNIEYSTKEHNDKGVLKGVLNWKLKNATVKVPFKCSTRVKFNTLPKFKVNTNQDEIEMLQTNIEVHNGCGGDVTGRDIREQSFRSIEFFNEKVFCELISAEFISTEFIESNIIENPINKECKLTLQEKFDVITENVVLFLTIKLLQKQNVIIPNL